MYFNNTDRACPKVDGKWCKAPYDDVVHHVLTRSEFPPTRVRFVKGPVEATLNMSGARDDEHAGRLPRRIAVLRLDTDFHASTAIELAVLWPRLAPGGWLYIDDFYDFGGARSATLEWLARSAPADGPRGAWVHEARRAGAFHRPSRTFNVYKADPYDPRHPFWIPPPPPPPPPTAG